MPNALLAFYTLLGAVNFMGSFRKYTAKVKSCESGIIALEHEEKMQVRPINGNGYVIEIKTKNDKVKLLKSEVKDLMEYFLRVAL